MAVFKDEAEVYQYTGGIFEEALADPVIGQKFAESGVILKVTHTEMEFYEEHDLERLVDRAYSAFGEEARRRPRRGVGRGECDEGD